MSLAGHMIVKNGVKFDYPFIESCLSVLPICDQFVFVEGHSDDGTYEKLKELQDQYPDKITIIQEVWDKAHYNVLSEMTNLAIRNCHCEYQLQIQADEVLHEQYHDKLRRAVSVANFDYGVLGIQHFYGSFSTVYKPGVYYDSFVRLARRSSYPYIRSYSDAMTLGCPSCSPNDFKRRDMFDVVVYHYGIVRKPAALIEKQTLMTQWWGYQELDTFLAKGKETGTICWEEKHSSDKLQPFVGTHPSVMQKWVQEREEDVKLGRVVNG
jgi:hypothetical protein